MYLDDDTTTDLLTWLYEHSTKHVVTIHQRETLCSVTGEGRYETHEYLKKLHREGFLTFEIVNGEYQIKMR